MFKATVMHHSISRAPVIEAGNSLAQAKRRATAEFGKGLNDHVLAVLDGRDGIVSVRKMDGRRWHDVDAGRLA